MCGIIGYIGGRQAQNLLIEGLRRMEYRGYDSAGVAIQFGGEHGVRKTAGKIGNLEKLIEANPIDGSCGIGHTRWATHGPPTTLNAHPHSAGVGRTVLVHNGIIENYEVLRRKLVELGHEFSSETDTEVLAHLIDEVFDGNLEQAVATSLSRVEGTYGIAVMHVDDPDKIVVARNGSPLLIGIGADGSSETFVASDVAAILAHTRNVVYLDDGELAVLTRDGHETSRVSEFGSGGIVRLIDKEVNHIDWDLELIERGGFEHFMLKEIYEQPDTVRDAMRGRLLEEEGIAHLG